jgi:hypothetical protein
MEPLLSKINTKSNTSESLTGSTMDLAPETLEKKSRNAADIAVKNEVLNKFITEPLYNIILTKLPLVSVFQRDIT